MIEYFAWVARTSVRLAWLALFVLPGVALMYAHVGIQRLAGQRVRPLPTLVYRSSGFLVAIITLYAVAAMGAYS
jgi:hypothetical protein